MDDEVIITFLVIAGILTLVKMITATVTNAIRSFHDNKQQSWSRDPDQIPPMFTKLVDRVMEERDETIADLQERIETLEKIVTDQHNQSKARRLSEEIDRLNDR